ncbi:hypothetical protein F4815DRAFT_323797 [Daldinia loculata]|nr:hypothetical protein F4815DRAFT_323797 [Daldinia loculata]
MDPFSILPGSVRPGWGSDPLPFSSSSSFEKVYNRGRRPFMSTTAARYMDRNLIRMLNPYPRRPSNRRTMPYLMTQGVNLSPERWDFIIDTIRNTPELDPDRMEGLEFTGLMDGLAINDKIDADGDIIMTDSTPISINTFVDDDTSMHIDTPMDIDTPVTLPPWSKDINSITVATASRPFPPTDIAMPGDHILENANEYTTPIKAPQQKQLVSGLDQLSLVGLHTRRKLENDADSPEEAQQPQRKIKKVTKIPSLERMKLLSVPKANGRSPRPVGPRYSRAAVSSTPSPEPIPIIKVTDPDDNFTYPF